MTLRTRFQVTLSLVLVLSIGATGAILIGGSSRQRREEILSRQLLRAQNRAFRLSETFDLLQAELARLAEHSAIDLADGDTSTERQLLESAHSKSVLYNTAVLLVDSDGACLLSVPAAHCANRKLDDRPWLEATRSRSESPRFYATDEPALGRALQIVQPIVRSSRFVGALVGVIALSQKNLISRTLKPNIPPMVDGILIDGTGRVLYPPNVDPWALRSIKDSILSATAHGQSGTLRAVLEGEDHLLAFAPVGVGAPFALVLRWPWSSLFSDLRKQVFSLVAILVGAIMIAGLVGVLLSARLTRPLHALSESAVRIGKGDYVPSGDLAAFGQVAELNALVSAFDRMQTSLRQRDAALQDAAADLELRVEARTHELAVAQRALVEAERFAAMGKTAAAIAHELKNSMGGLGMAIDLILQDPANVPRTKRLRAQVVAEVTRLRDVTDGLLSLSKKPQVLLSLDDLSAVMERAAASLTDIVEYRKAALSLNLAHPLSASFDRSRIHSVLVNLLKNAVEAGHRVEVRTLSEGEAAVIEVADDGPGLSSDATLHLFEPFYTTKPNGTGLGLSTARRFIEAHHGTIEVGRSKTLGGALIRVTLPLDGARPLEVVA